MIQVLNTNPPICSACDSTRSELITRYVPRATVTLRRCCDCGHEAHFSETRYTVPPDARMVGVRVQANVEGF